MSALEEVHFSPKECHKETLELQQLLSRKQSLKEKDDLLPFFKSRKHLSAFIGSYVAGIVNYNRVAHEFSLKGSFFCDLVVGDWHRRHYAFVEFEDASSHSVFSGKKGRRTPEWSRRFEHGFSQLVDWFFMLDDERETTEFQNAFGDKSIDYTGLLILGRDQSLGVRETRRLAWRTQYVQIHAKTIHCITLDQLCKDLLERLNVFQVVSKPVGDEASRGTFDASR